MNTRKAWRQIRIISGWTKGCHKEVVRFFKGRKNEKAALRKVVR